MTSRAANLSRQFSFYSIALAALSLVALAIFGWWAASRIDERSIARQGRAILAGLTEVTERIAVEQDGSIVWDDAVLGLRENDEDFIADNLAEWMSAYFDHDRIYILDDSDQLVRAVENGALANTSLYAGDALSVAPLVRSLREKMASASGKLMDSTEAISGLGLNDIVVLGDGRPAIASVRPVRPETLNQAPGQEFLHISIRLIDPDLIGQIAEKYEIDQLKFVETEAGSIGDVAIPVQSRNGRIIGFFIWSPEEPAWELVADTAPAVLGGVVMSGLALALLLLRLNRTSLLLEDSKAKASYLAFHDPLTGIPNRALFEDRLDQALANMRRTSSTLALHYIDLDRFKHVNDTLGHPAGDALIKEAAQRLIALVSEVDTVARLGGDEFAVIQFHAADTEQALVLGQQIVDRLGLPFDINDQVARVGASVGVVVTSDGEAKAEDLMREADIALYEAKNSGRGRFQLFAGQLDEAVKERRLLEIDLREAINQDFGLQLVYQPIFDAPSGLVAGAEALIRWDHPQRGRLAPQTFIGLAEERGLIDQLGIWVLRTACRFAARCSLPWVAVNVSPVQFRDEWFADRVFEVLAETGLDPKRLEIEITEGLLLQNSPTIQGTLRRLRGKGIRVALDDFGTGYSSISYLRHHGVDKLKIDQSFTALIGQDREITSIIQSIVDLGRAMHMTVTAEGVETEEQRDSLKALGCDQLQGYLLSRPVAADQLLNALAVWEREGLKAS